MSDIFRFFYIALHHWTTWVTGTGLVGFLLWLLNFLEKRRIEKGRKPMTFRQNSTILFCTFWFLATFSVWRDADKKLGACSSALTSEGVKIDFLDAQTKSQQQTLNSCIVQLGKANTPIPQKTTPLFYEDDGPSPPPAKHAAIMMFMTNKPNTPAAFLIHCSPSVKWAHASIVGGPMIGGASRTADGAWKVNITLPQWGPDSPLWFKVYYDQDELPTCSAQHL